MGKIKKLLIHEFIFGLNNKQDEEIKFRSEGHILLEYCKIIPFINENGEKKLQVNIAEEKDEKEIRQKCTIQIAFESNEENPNILSYLNDFLDVLFYDLYTNNEDGRLEQWHILVRDDEEEE
ncbi:MAG: hypothetical protein WCH65_03375 [bacterium]